MNSETISTVINQSEGFSLGELRLLKLLHKPFAEGGGAGVYNFLKEIEADYDLLDRGYFLITRNFREDGLYSETTNIHRAGQAETWLKEIGASLALVEDAFSFTLKHNDDLIENILFRSSMLKEFIDDFLGPRFSIHSFVRKYYNRRMIDSGIVSLGMSVECGLVIPDNAPLFYDLLMIRTDDEVKVKTIIRNSNKFFSKIPEAPVTLRDELLLLQPGFHKERTVDPKAFRYYLNGLLFHHP